MTLDQVVGVVDLRLRCEIEYGFHWVLTPIDQHPLDDSDLPTVRI